MKIYASLLLLASPIAAFVAQPSFTGVSKTALNAEVGDVSVIDWLDWDLEVRDADLRRAEQNLHVERTRRYPHTSLDGMKPNRLSKPLYEKQ